MQSFNAVNRLGRIQQVDFCKAGCWLFQRILNLFFRVLAKLLKVKHVKQEKMHLYIYKNLLPCGTYVYSSADAVDTSSASRGTPCLFSNFRMLHRSSSQLLELLDSGRRSNDSRITKIPCRKYLRATPVQDSHDPHHQQHPTKRLRHLQVHGEKSERGDRRHHSTIQ